MLWVFFMSTLCQITEIHFYSKFTKNIFHEWVLNFIRFFFSTYLNDKMIFILYSVNTVNYSTRFMWWVALPDFFFEWNSLDYWIKPKMVMIYCHCYSCLGLLLLCFRFFAFMLMRERLAFFFFFVIFSSFIIKVLLAS